MKRILIVDDDVAVTNYFMVFLMQTEMFDVTVENDSRNVEGLLAEGGFDLMLLDMDMPNISGMEILRRMRARGDEMPVIILTGVSDVDLAVKAMKLDAFDYLVKPVDDDTLLEVIENAVEHDALHQSIERLP
ncbi:MAG: response regulator, partial [Candidatus Fermentibacterota bacterium]